MAKLYYGDENNTAVEINVKGDPGPGVADGGTTGQVLAKKSATDYDTKWIDPPSGSDPDAIKKDGTTVTTARIPFAQGIGIDSDNYWTERDFVSLTFSDTGGYTQIQNSNGNVAALYAIGSDGGAILNGVRVETDGLQIMANKKTGTAGQVLTAKGNGTCSWQNATGGSDYEEVESDDGTIMIIRVGKLRIAFNTGYVDFRVEMTNGEGFLTSPVTIGQVPYEDRPTLGGATPHADYSTTDVDNESYKIMNFTVNSYGTITAYSYVKGPVSSSAINFSYPPYNVIGVWKVE